MSNPALRLNVFIAHPSYGGNGGISSEHPDIREWACETILKMKADPRIGEIHTKTIADTPITAVRNQFVRMAREVGAHVLLMVDSDQSPNKHKGEPWFKPFWDVAFDEVYNHYGKGPLVVGAPYCGPPNTTENVYVFQFDSNGTGRGDETKFELSQYTRAQAALMSGVQECAALPTGMILYDMRAFELIEPTPLSKEQVLEQLIDKKISKTDALRMLSEGWFYYEWTTGYADEKASTEDVTNTRDIALAGIVKLGYNPLRCAWDSWVGHHKPWNVGKPETYRVEQVANTLKRAVESNVSLNDRIVNLGDPLERMRELGIADRPIHNARPAEQPTEPRWIGSDVTHLNALEDLVVARAKRKFPQGIDEHSFLNVVEIGSWIGASAKAMADTGLARVMCVDTFEGSPTDLTGEFADEVGGSVLEAFKRNVGDRLNKSIFYYNTDSMTAAGTIASGLNGFTFLPADIVFIDADHSYESTKADILAWLPHVADDGVMIGHDYITDQFPGVVKAVQEVFGGYAKPYAWSPDHGGFWMVEMSEFRKPERNGQELSNAR